MHRTPPTITRRSLLRGGLALGAAIPLLSACGGADGGDDDTTTGATDEAGHGHEGLVAEATGAPVLTGIFDPQAYAVAGAAQRLPLAVRSAEGVPELDVPATLDVTVRRDGEDIGPPVAVARHDAGIPLPFFPLRTTFPEPGRYDLVADLGQGEVTVPVRVAAPGQQPLLAVGDTLPNQQTPTVGDELGVVPICTHHAGTCAFHDQSLATVGGDGRPVVLMVGTPAYCHIGVCGPVLDLLLEAARRHPGPAYLHTEVYRNAEAVGPDRATPAPIMAALGLTFEPSLWVADGDGVVVERLDFVFDRTEIEAALALVA